MAGSAIFGANAGQESGHTLRNCGLSAQRRRQEIGIRVFLGAQHGDISRLVLGSGFKVCFVGIAFGLLLSFFAMRLITSIFYGVAPTDLWIFSAGSLPVSALSHLANYIPVHCAARIDLMIALRYE